MKKDYDLTEFFHEMGDAVEVFKHKTQVIPGANINGCLVRKGKNTKKNKVQFSFLAKDNSVVEVELSLKDLFASPQEYIAIMLEGIDNGLQQMSNQSRFILMPRLGATHA